MPAIWQTKPPSYLSLHCFPILPGRCWAIKAHRHGPSFSTICATISSSYIGDKYNSKQLVNKIS